MIHLPHWLAAKRGFRAFHGTEEQASRLPDGVVEVTLGGWGFRGEGKYGVEREGWRGLDDGSNVVYKEVKEEGNDRYNAGLPYVIDRSETRLC